ncbi:MAG: sugar transferase [Candidatus Omnitrophica bacterium]|nr:sugar transferase [Candidatus Omnitrophota bacterium]
MHKLNKRVRIAYFFVDIAFIIISFYEVFKLNFGLIQFNPEDIKLYLSVYFFWGVVLVFLLHNAYLHHTNRYLSVSGEWLKVGRCVLLASILTALFIFVLKLDIFSRAVFIESSFALLLSLSAWRTIKRLCVRYLIRKGYANYNILIIGAGNAGLALADETKAFPYLGIKAVGFLDDVRVGERNGIKILGKINDIEQVVKNYFIDEIYVTIPSERRISGEIIQKGTKLGKTVRVAAEHFGLPYSQVRLNYIGAIPLLTYFEESGYRTRNMVKRLLDIFISVSILVLFLPLFVLIACLIKIESYGPVFYISKRSGRKGVIFDFYKFRSMIKGADSHKESLKSKSEVEGPIFKIRNDPRLTKAGRFLRKYSLDELPQLINVLKGDMSLVGPRPFPVEESNNIEYKHIPRLNIRPGITGLAQIKGRSDLKFSQWMRWDIWYVKNWSLGLDIKILFWTIPVVFKGKGAY